jgi:hypothetical protein
MVGDDVASDFFKSPVAKTRRVQSKKKMPNERDSCALCLLYHLFRYCVPYSIDELMSYYKLKW